MTSPDETTSNKAKVNGIAAVGRILAIIAVGIVMIHRAERNAQDEEKREQDRQFEERMGGAACYPLWKAVELEQSRIQAEDENLFVQAKDIGLKSFSEEALNARAEKKIALEKGFRDKVRQWRLCMEKGPESVLDREFSKNAKQWIACVEKREQKNAPVAMQPKLLQRSRIAP